MSRKIKPQFTFPQAGEIRVALDSLIQFRAANGYDYRAALNALEELDQAQRAASERDHLTQA